MGNAAYERGTQVIRNSIDRDVELLPKRHPAEVALFHAERINSSLKEKIAALQSELETAKKYLAVARAERNVLKEELREQEMQIHFWKTLCSSIHRQCAKFRRSWLKASNLLRLIPASVVSEAREEGKHRDGVF